MKNYAKPNMEIIYVGTEDDVIRTSTVDNVKNSNDNTFINDGGWDLGNLTNGN